MPIAASAAQEPAAEAVIASAEAVAASDSASHRALLDRYCVTCHNEGMVNGRGRAASPLVGQLRAVGLTLDTLDLAEVGSHADAWEKVVRKLRGGVMPPAGRPRPPAEDIEAFLTWLEGELDGAWAETRDPGRTATFHRLNRTEYRNAIRDLLAVELDADNFLPADDASFGFDNIGGILRMSQSLMERYLAAARTISRLAVGSAPPAMSADTYEAAQDLPQHGRVEALPFGTRGGLYIEHLFPRDAEYDVRVELTGTRRLRENHDLEVTLDGEAVKLVTLSPQRDGAPDIPYTQAATVDFRLPVAAGPREVGVTFFKKPSALVEQVREPFPNPRVAGNTGGLAGRQPFVRSVTITGPYGGSGVTETPSRERIFTCRPPDTAGEASCAHDILSGLARRAYRRPVTADEMQVLLDFYGQGRRGGSFEDGVELALRRLLVSPEFLYRIEADPAAAAPGEPYRVPGLELASRLSFFLWSSIPDDELLDAAEQGRLSDPAELERQVRRMVADPRSATLTTNFAAQWLQLRNLETTIRPGDPFSVAFDESLRQSMLRETELFVDRIVRDDRPRHGRPADGRLHVPERAAGRALRDSRRDRQPLPARRSAGRRQPARHPGARQHPDVDVARHPDVAGAARQVDPGQPARHAAAGSAAQYPGPERPEDPGQAPDPARADGGAPQQPGLLGLPLDDRPDRLRAGELRRHRALARRRRIVQHDRSVRRAARRPGLRGRRGDAAGAGRQRRAVRHHGDREADDLRPRPRPRALRHADAAPHRARGGGGRLPVPDRHSRHRQE